MIFRMEPEMMEDLVFLAEERNLSPGRSVVLAAGKTAEWARMPFQTHEESQATHIPVTPAWGWRQRQKDLWA